MISRLLIFILFTFLLYCNSMAQGSYTISGYVKDTKNGESLIAASIRVKSSSQGALSNEYGFFSLTLSEGKYPIEVSYLGYNSFDTLLDLYSNVRINIELTSASRNVQEVIINATRKDENVHSSEMGKINLSIEKIKTLPAIFGEIDILKSIQLLPGVQSGGEAGSGFYVRGGGPDQNLILLDEAVVYNSSHLFGFFSVFNSDAILNTTLYKGGMPANYGGRVSSVLDISMREGNNKSFHASGGIGLIASRLMIEGPLKKK